MQILHFKSLCIYLFVYVYGHTHVTYVCMSEKNLQESALPFLHVSARDQTQVVSLGSEHLYLLSHLASISSLLPSPSPPVCVCVCAFMESGGGIGCPALSLATLFP